jgi:hypothetical protein
MKRMIMTLAIAVIGLSAFAGEVKVNTAVLNSFNTEFTGATEVRWIESGDYYKADFVFNGQSVAAFYSVTGDLMGVTRHISSLDLSETLQAKLKNDYDNFWITGLSEVSTEDDMYYYVTLENADSKIVLKSSYGKKWTLVKKMAKA